MSIGTANDAWSRHPWLKGTKNLSERCMIQLFLEDTKLFSVGMFTVSCGSAETSRVSTRRGIEAVMLTGRNGQKSERYDALTVGTTHLIRQVPR